MVYWLKVTCPLVLYYNKVFVVTGQYPLMGNQLSHPAAPHLAVAPGLSIFTLSIFGIKECKVQYTFIVLNQILSLLIPNIQTSQYDLSPSLSLSLFIYINVIKWLKRCPWLKVPRIQGIPVIHDKESHQMLIYEAGTVYIKKLF